MERYKLKEFAKWAKRQGVSDEVLHDALEEMSKGLIGDSIGSNVYKKRIALPGRGKSGGARTILIFKQDELAVFLHGYAKNDKADLEPREEQALRVFAKAFLALPLVARNEKVEDGIIIVLEEP